MLKKRCSNCGEYTYCASDGSWTCAYCGEDLNDQEAQPAGNSLSEQSEEQSKDV